MPSGQWDIKDAHFLWLFEKGIDGEEFSLVLPEKAAEFLPVHRY